jgi:hypothetical protein
MTYPCVSCDREIDSEADPCPGCGKPQAGAAAREHASWKRQREILADPILAAAVRKKEQELEAIAADVAYRKRVMKWLLYVPLAIVITLLLNDAGFGLLSSVFGGVLVTYVALTWLVEV